MYALYLKKAVDPTLLEKKYMQLFDSFNAEKIKTMTKDELQQLQQDMGNKFNALFAGDRKLGEHIMIKTGLHPALATAIAREIELTENRGIIGSYLESL